MLRHAAAASVHCAANCSADPSLYRCGVHLISSKVSVGANIEHQRTKLCCGRDNERHVIKRGRKLLQCSVFIPKELPQTGEKHQRERLQLDHTGFQDISGSMPKHRAAGGQAAAQAAHKVTTNHASSFAMVKPTKFGCDAQSQPTSCSWLKLSCYLVRVRRMHISNVHGTETDWP